MYAHALPAIHAVTDGSLEPSVSAPINITLQLHRPLTIHKALHQELNGTAVLQSNDLQTEKIRKWKNQNDCS